MNGNPWAGRLVYVTGLVNQELLLQNEYLGRVEDWRHGSVGSAYPLLPVSFGSASLADDPAGDGAKPEGTGCRSCDLVICNEAPGSGSKPSRQWRGSTPITSVVPDSVRKAVVTVGVKPG